MRARSSSLGLLFALALAGAARAQAPDTSLWVPTGPVSAVVPIGGTLYIAGQFSRIGPNTGCAVPFDPVTAQPILPFARVPGVVHAVLPDGAGGWYVGGAFDGVDGQPVRNLCHLLANGHVAAWAPDPDSEVFALSISGNTLYAGGRFEHIGGAARYKLGAVDLTTGAATAFDAGMTKIAPGTWPYVHALAATPAAVYVGGFFFTIGGQSRPRVAALDPATGLATSWNSNCDGTVFRFVPVGGTVFAGGNFLHIGGQARSAIAELDAVTGDATSWSPSSIHGFAYDIAVTATQVYACGSFDYAGIAGRGDGAAFDRATAALLPFDPASGGVVHSIALDGSTVYLAGDFPDVGGQPRNGLAAVEATTGALKPWAPDVNRLCCTSVAGSQAIAVANGVVFAGGSFTSVGGVARTNVAALDLGTGHPTSWAPFVNNSVNDMTTDGTWLYLGGYFGNVGGSPSAYLGRVSVTSGAWDATWAPTPGSVVTCLARAGNTLYVGGYFSSMNGQGRNTIAALDLNNANLLPWAPVTSGGPMNQIVPDVANNAVTAASQGGFWRFRASDGATLWSATIDGAPYTTTQVGGTVYVGGSFQHVDGVARNSVAALDAASGAVSPWAPEPDRVVSWLDTDGSRVFVGGDFRSIAGQARTGIAVLDAASGAADPYDPHVGAGAGGFVSMRPLRVAGADLYACGGQFMSVGYFAAPGFARLSSAPPLDVPRPQRVSDRLSMVAAPLPASGSLHLNWSLPRSGNTWMDVIDALGRQVARPLAGSWREAGPGAITLRTDGWRPGVYMVRLRANGAEVHKRIVVVP
jgi:hypothetical protein